MSRRAMSKRLCFIASMPRSNKTLSGCLESTLASGLSTFLLVQAVVIASVAARAITEDRDKNMKNLKLDLLSFRTALAVGNLLLCHRNRGRGRPRYTFCSVASNAAFNNV